MRKSPRALGDHKARRAAGLTVDPPSRRRRARLPCSAPLSELQVHLAVVAHLRHQATRGTWWFHPANGEIRDGRTAAKLKSMGVKAGTPDRLFLRRGQMFALELMRPGGRLSSAQSWSAKALFGVVPTDEGPCLAVGAVCRQLQEGRCSPSTAKWLSTGTKTTVGIIETSPSSTPRGQFCFGKRPNRQDQTDLRGS
jgi:hypothetical protein